LHDGFPFSVNTGGATAEVPYSCGVKQGESFAAVLFLFFFQAAMEHLDSKWDMQAPIFASNNDGDLSGGHWGKSRKRRRGEEEEEAEASSRL